MKICVIDSSVILKSVLKPSRSLLPSDANRENRTHHNCRFLMQMLAEYDIIPFIPRAALLEVGGVTSRLDSSDMARQHCLEIESAFQVIDESVLFKNGLKIAIDGGCPGYDSLFLSLCILKDATLFTDDRRMSEIALSYQIHACLMREMNQESIIRVITK